MKKIFVGLFCFLAFSAEIGSTTYQRVTNTTNPQLNQTQSKTTARTTGTAASAATEESLIEWHMVERLLGIGEDRELTFPAGLKVCKVYDARSLEKAILKATWKGDCEWIVLRSSSDWDPMAPLWMQMEKPLVIEDRHENAKGHPLVITNDTGRAIIFKAPKNEGCAVIIKKPDVAILGFTFEGAVCH